MTRPLSVAARDELSQYFGESVAFGVSLANYSTYRVGGDAAALVQLSDASRLEDLHRIVTSHNLATLVIGRGSNLLVSSQGFPGLVIQLVGSFESIEMDWSSQRVTAGGAVLLPVLARQASGAGHSGLEWMVGIPGTVGGAVRMNAGGHGSDVAATLTTATLFDLDSGSFRSASPQGLDLSYRSSKTRSSEIVVSASFMTAEGNPETSMAVLSEIVAWRRAHQPGGANGGSVFANPPGASAGALIDQCGGKGSRVGGAAVSDKHANFIVCDSGATAEDVYSLIGQTIDLVRGATGVTLRPENVLIGFE